ncbi:hypothetical protein BURPS1106B_2412 [Burkholderia pseudomallei 1106b]|uniref:Uncharacterized protein n=1 Tax=Burkholderia pseudomallei (strain 1106a) TaxID=357348 RepID=A3P8Y0_BURP0|nr:hypothetical protein BURPS1106A_A2762 [Burkholderia pseudomallei 1106a]EES21155.1 hypothetical protein BURPS1106B_2412 [Burkholderia pseudomallei 1106b]
MFNGMHRRCILRRKPTAAAASRRTANATRDATAGAPPLKAGNP